jgi:hypothetical protein
MNAPGSAREGQSPWFGEGGADADGAGKEKHGCAQPLKVL